MKTNFSLGIHLTLISLVSLSRGDSRVSETDSISSNSVFQSNASSALVNDKLVQLLKDISDSLRGDEATTTRKEKLTPYPSVDEITLENLQSIILAQERRISELESLMKKKCDERSEGSSESQESDGQFRKLEARLRALEFLLEESPDSKSSMKQRRGRNFIGDYSNNVLSGDEDSYYNVAFDAYRNEPFYRPQSYINYDGTNVNIGRGLNPRTGIFVAPLPGIYLFSFHALTKDGQPSYVKLNHNGRNVAGSYRRHEVEMPAGMPDYKDRIENSKAEGMLSQTVLLNLSKGDEVGVFAYHGNIRDGGWHYTHFVGVRIN